MCFVITPPATVFLLYRLLGPIALIVTILVSHYLIRGHIDYAWDKLRYSSLIETLLVAASAMITAALFAELRSGGRRLCSLMPLSLLPVPIVLLNRTTDYSMLDKFVCYEYCFYGLTLLFLLPAFTSSLGEFHVRKRAILHLNQSVMPAPFTYKTLTDPVSASNKRLLGDAVDKTVLAAAVCAPFVPLANLIAVSHWYLQAFVYSSPKAVNAINLSFPENAGDWLWRENSTHDKFSTQKEWWSFRRLFTLGVAYFFESPVSLFAAASSLALLLFWLLFAIDKGHCLCAVPNAHRRVNFLMHMSHVRRVDVGVGTTFLPTVAYALFALVCYGFANKSFFAMEPAERVDRLCYLHIWLVVCAIRLLCSALGFHLQTMPYEYTRNLTKGLFVNVALHVLLLAPSSFFIWYCWPHGSMPFWQYFWAVVIVLNAVTSVIYSLLRVSSALCTVCCSRVIFKVAEVVLLAIKLIWTILLIVCSLWLFALASAEEWNALTLVMLICYVICQGFSAGRIANGLWTACRGATRSSRSPFTENLYQKFVDEVHVAGQQGCGLCGCSFRMNQINELQIERLACDEGPHYFHTACCRLWLIDHSICPMCRHPQQPPCIYLIDFIAVAVRFFSFVAMPSRSGSQETLDQGHVSTASGSLPVTPVHLHEDRSQW